MLDQNTSAHTTNYQVWKLRKCSPDRRLAAFWLKRLYAHTHKHTLACRKDCWLRKLSQKLCSSSLAAPLHAINRVSYHFDCDRCRQYHFALIEFTLSSPRQLGDCISQNYYTSWDFLIANQEDCPSFIFPIRITPSASILDYNWLLVEINYPTPRKFR